MKANKAKLSDQEPTFSSQRFALALMSVVPPEITPDFWNRVPSRATACVCVCVRVCVCVHLRVHLRVHMHLCVCVHAWHMCVYMCNYESQSFNSTNVAFMQCVTFVLCNLKNSSVLCTAILRGKKQW